MTMRNHDFAQDHVSVSVSVSVSGGETDYGAGKGQSMEFVVC